MIEKIVTAAASNLLVLVSPTIYYTSTLQYVVVQREAQAWATGPL
jgi:hypothetical protein